MSRPSFPNDGASRASALAGTAPGDRATSDERAQAASGGTRALTLTWARGQLVAWFVLSLVYLVTTAVQAHAPAGGTGTRLAQYAYGAGHFFAIGAVIAGSVFAWRRLRPRAGALQGYLGAGIAAFVVGWPLLGEDFLNLASGAKHVLVRRLIRAGLTLAVAAMVPLAALAGRALARVGLRPAALAIAVTAAGASCFVAPQAYLGLHLFAAVIAATMMGVAFAGVAVRPALSFLAGSPRLAGPWTIAAVWGAWSIVTRPPAPVLFELFRTPGAVLAPFVAPLHVVPPPVNEAALLARWPALAAPPAPAPPGAPALVPSADPVVVLVTVDCFRADVLAGGAHDSVLPNLAALREQSVFFTDAHTTAASTVIGLSSIFTGKIYSQLTWSNEVTSRGGKPLPFHDPSTRFPELLSRAGVATVTYAPTDWLSSKFRLVTGFREEEVLSQGSRYAFSSALVDRAVRRIEEHAAGPLFLYLHFLDAHAPYDLAGEEGSAFERYVRELGLVDEQVGRLLAALSKKGLDDRATLIVTADHGEAFGEHHTEYHKFTVYSELARVPLLVRAPSARPRAVNDPVSLLDVGPTVLDLFGQPAPAAFAGQTLVPALRGERLSRLRPLAYESDLHEALLFDDGFKVIRHKQRGTVELYDLARDPAEMSNLFHERDAAAVERLGVLGAFFERARRQ